MQHDKHEKRATLLALWLVGLLLVGLFPLIASNAGATTTDVIQEYKMAWGADSASYAWISGSGNPWSYHRYLFVDFDLSSDVPAGALITNVHVVWKLTDWYVGATPVGLNATNPFTSNGNGGLTGGETCAGISPAGSRVAQIALDGNLGWKGMDATSDVWQTEFDTNGHIYLGFSSWDFENNPVSAQIGTFTGSPRTTPYIKVTYTYPTWAPTITSTPGTVGTVGTSYSYSVTTNETSTKISVTKPSWASFTSPTFSGTPTTPGTFPFCVQANSTAGLRSVKQYWNVTVTSPSGHWAPTFTSSPITSGTAGVSYAYHAILNESANMTYLGAPAWLSLTHNNTGGPWYLNGTPPSAGSYAVHLRAHSDAGTLYSYQNFTIIVAVAPGAFIITSSPVTNGIVNASYTYHVTANQSVSAWNVSGAGAGATSGWLNLEPAADAYVSSANPNTNYGTSTGLIARYDYPSIDYNQVFLRWNISTLPVGAVIDHAYLNLYQYAHSGSAGDVTLTENAITDWKETALTYNNEPAQLDYVHVANQYTLGWKNYTDAKLDAWVAAQCSASSKVSLGFLRSASGATVYDTFYSRQYTSNHPYLSIHYTVTTTSWLTFDSNGYLNGTPLTAGTYSIHVMATNGTGSHAYQNYTLTVKNPWAPTFLNSPATTGSSSHLYIYTPSCNESVTYTIYYVPANPWASFIGNVLSGTPTSASTWVFNLRATSTAGTLSAWKNWTLVITAAWNPHFTSSPSLTVLKLHAYLYNFVCNESCSFTTDTKPSWASAGASSVSGTPPVGGYFAFVIHATNSQGGVAYQYWNVTVLPLPFPAFTSTPNYVAILHVSYSYTVSTDITCIITITDAPSWLHYSSTTHKLTGVCPYNGVFTVTLCATSTVYGTQQNQSFSIVAVPTMTPLNVDQQLLAIIPLLILLALIIICCISREEGFSGTMFMGTLAIGIALLVWTETMPSWTIVVTAAIIGLMIYREVR